MTRPRLPLVAAAALALAACGGGGGGDGGSGDAQAAPAPGRVLVSGKVTFDFVPVALDRGIPMLDYSATEPRPARRVTVQAVPAGGPDDEILAEAATGDDGRYSLPLEPGTDVLILVRAEMIQPSPAWDFRVVDNTQGGALFVLESDEVATGSEDTTVDLHAESGWDGTAYTAPRAAAPFAILDVVYESAAAVAGALPASGLPPLTLHWSPDNVPSRGDNGQPDLAGGEIGSSLYASGLGIFILGAANSDTDEYDRHVIAHEWGHYLEHALARSDSIGGPHTRGDQLDMRTAFSEGLSNAFSAIALGDSVYKDTLGPNQNSGFLFDVEGPFFPGSNPASRANPHPGWFSEESVQELVYDLFDDSVDIPEDQLALGVEPILAALSGAFRDSTALTSVFSFVSALKAALPDRAPQIDALVGVHDIAPVVDPYGKDEDNAGTPTFGSDGGLLAGSGDSLDAEGGSAASDVLPIYKPIEVDGAAVEVCSTDDYSSSTTGSVNKLGSRAFLRFDVSSPGLHHFTATTTVMPDGESADPDMRLHRRGLLDVSNAEPGEDCVAGQPGQCIESFSRTLSQGEHVLEVYEWTNTATSDDYPPIGRTCFAVEISR